MCHVILAIFDGEAAMQSAIAQLKEGLGNSWSHITAFFNSCLADAGSLQLIAQRLKSRCNYIWLTW